MENEIAIKEITLVQLPIIKHQLKEVGKEVTKRIEALDIENLVATTETLQSLKRIRTELNKDFLTLESRRKIIKTELNKAYAELEEVYKPEITEKYKAATDALKDKIASVEDKIKSDKKEDVEQYFNELCVSEKIDFISFDKLEIEIKLSTTAKKYKEQVYDYISKINDDLNLIKSTDFEAETLTEYKTSLNVSSAITTVKTRKENEAKETARLKAVLVQQRKNHLESIGMQFVEITNSYEFNSEILIEVSDIENLDKDEYVGKVATCEAKITDFKAKELSKQNSATITAPTTGGAQTAVLEKPVVKQVVSAPVTAPKVEKKTEPLKVAQFEVKATMTQLRALGAYMKSNNINYKNI